MAHFAKIGLNSKVIQVTTMDNEVMKDADGNEVEANGQQWLELHNNWPAQMWIQTSYNTLSNTHSSGDNTKAFRGNYAGIGYTWDEDNNIFWSKQPFDLTATKISENQDGTHGWVYTWNEETTAWDLTDELA